MKLGSLLVTAVCAAVLGLGQGAAAKKAPPPPPPPVSKDASKLVDLNAASKEDLAKLPVIGKVKADAIVKARPFKGKDELVSKGILTAAEYAKVKDLIIAKQK